MDIPETLIARLDALIADWRAQAVELDKIAEEQLEIARKASMRLEAQMYRRLAEQLASALRDAAHALSPVSPIPEQGKTIKELPSGSSFTGRLIGISYIDGDPLEREASVSPSSEGWQPIATAPKDGTQVWLWWDGFLRLAHWHEAVNPPSIGGRFANWLTDDKGSVSAVTKPTQWHPLPAPPAVSGDGQMR